MKKLIIFGIIIIILGLTIYFGSNILLNVISQNATGLLTRTAPSYGFEVVSADFGKARMTSFKSAQWSGVHLSLLKKDRTGITRPIPLTLDMQSMTLYLLDKNQGAIEAFMVDGKYGGSMQTAAKAADRLTSEDVRQGKIWLDHFYMLTSIDLFNPLPGIKDMIRQVSIFFNSGLAPTHIDLNGKIWITLGNQEFQVKMKTVETREGSMLILNRKDLRRLSFYFNEQLTDEEIEIVAVNPMIANKLLGIKDYARRTSQRTLMENANISEDAFRHVLWSYMLTKEFGPKFAKVVTDAHEEGMTGNTPQEREMDYTNNAVGRLYARQGVLEAEILRRVMRDPHVILHAK